jgi:hypothetical protein
MLLVDEVGAGLSPAPLYFIIKTSIQTASRVATARESLDGTITD